jgi:hypothetical protein
VFDIKYPLKQVINAAIRPLGYELNNLRRLRQQKDGWEQYKFVRPDGSFNYEEYRRLQVWKSKRDINVVWASEKNIDFISLYLREHLKNPPKFGLCHGTKRGDEQQWFMKYLGPDVTVLGTEIADHATEFPNTIQWDFHEVKPEWRNAADFVYSNALDHSYDPQKAIGVWMSSVKPGGFCIIEWHVFGEPLSLTDPFSADILQLLYAITRWGEGAYCVRELIPTPANPQYIVFVIIYKFPDY